MKTLQIVLTGLVASVTLGSAAMARRASDWDQQKPSNWSHPAPVAGPVNNPVNNEPRARHDAADLNRDRNKLEQDERDLRRDEEKVRDDRRLELHDAHRLDERRDNHVADHDRRDFDRDRRDLHRH